MARDVLFPTTLINASYLYERRYSNVWCLINSQISERLGELFCSRRWLPLVFAFCLQRLGIGTKRPVCARAGSLPASQDRRKAGAKIKFSTQSDVMMSSFYGEEIEKNPDIPCK